MKRHLFRQDKRPYANNIGQKPRKSFAKTCSCILRRVRAYEIAVNLSLTTAIPDVPKDITGNNNTM